MAQRGNSRRDGSPLGVVISERGLCAVLKWYIINTIKGIELESHNSVDDGVMEVGVMCSSTIYW